jgi:subtilisin family serine protease
MALPQPLLAMCRDTVKIEPWSSVNSYGAPTYGTGTSYAARIVGHRKIVRDATGQEVVSSAKITVAADVTVDMRSRITLSAVPGGCTATPKILSVDYFPWLTSGGLSHTVIYV